MCFSIALCDDNELQLSNFEKQISLIMTKKKQKFEIIRYNSSLEFINDFKQDSNKYDLIFLDVSMPGMCGIEVGKVIRTMNKEVDVVYATGHMDYAFYAFEIRAFNYILKPIKHEKLEAIMEDFFAKVKSYAHLSEKKKSYFTIHEKNALINISFDDIHYIEKINNKAVINCTDQKYEVYESLVNLMKQLDGTLFLRTHQGYIVNIQKIINYKKQLLTLVDGHTIPVSKKNIKMVRDAFFTELRRG